MRIYLYLYYSNFHVYNLNNSLLCTCLEIMPRKINWTWFIDAASIATAHDFSNL